MNRIIDAARFAQLCHRGQLRKYTGAPYITHPARVATRMMLRPDATEEYVCAAWLHDVCEDCGVSPEVIHEMFGEAVCGIVVGMTNTSKKLHPEMNRAQRKEIDIQRIAAYCREVQNLKAIDRIDNLSEMAGAPEKFHELYLRESRQLLSALTRADADLRHELDAAITASSSPSSPPPRNVRIKP